MDEKWEEQQLSEAELTSMIENICSSKAEEFLMLGYEQVKPAEIWQCVSREYGDSQPQLHRLVNDILSLKPNQFMNWLTRQMYQNPEN